MGREKALPGQWSITQPFKRKGFPTGYTVNHEDNIMPSQIYKKTDNPRFHSGRCLESHRRAGDGEPRGQHSQGMVPVRDIKRLSLCVLVATQQGDGQLHST